jgi:hypothetical protein
MSAQQSGPNVRSTERPECPLKAAAGGSIRTREWESRVMLQRFCKMSPAEIG